VLIAALTPAVPKPTSSSLPPLLAIPLLYSNCKGLEFTMKGIQYVVDDSGSKTAVLIDLDMHGELWEDVYDAYMAEQRLSEPTEPFDDIVSRLKAAGKLDAAG
jgi:hypothetical protein